MQLILEHNSIQGTAGAGLLPPTETEDRLEGGKTSSFDQFCLQHCWQKMYLSIQWC